MKAMTVNEYMKNVETKGISLEATYIGAYFGETENLTNVVDAIDLDLDYEMLDIEIDQDGITDHDTYLVISKKDYQDLLNRLNERDGL